MVQFRKLGRFGDKERGQAPFPVNVIGSHEASVGNGASPQQGSNALVSPSFEPRPRFRSMGRARSLPGKGRERLGVNLRDPCGRYQITVERTDARTLEELKESLERAREALDREDRFPLGFQETLVSWMTRSCLRTETSGVYSPHP